MNLNIVTRSKIVYESNYKTIYFCNFIHWQNAKTHFGKFDNNSKFEANLLRVVFHPAYSKIRNFITVIGATLCTGGGEEHANSHIDVRNTFWKTLCPNRKAAILLFFGLVCCLFVCLFVFFKLSSGFLLPYLVCRSFCKTCTWVELWDVLINTGMCIFVLDFCFFFRPTLACNFMICPPNFSWYSSELGRGGAVSQGS